MNDLITQKWKDETILQARELAEREFRSRLFRHIDRYNKAFNNGDALIGKEAELDILNLVENQILKSGIEQALAERERVLGIVDDNNLGGQLNYLKEQIERV